jgi:hypothetical protein
MESDKNGTPTAHDKDLADQIKQMGSGEVAFSRPPQAPGKHRASREDRRKMRR